MTQIVALGEIMGRLSPPGYQRWEQSLPGQMQVLFAGAEASVAMSIAYLGGNSAFVTALPDHELGDACLASVRALGVDTRHIVRTANSRLGLYFLESGVNQRPGKVIYDREHSAMATTPPEAYDWDEILHDADWLVLSGITSAISRNGHAVALAAAQAAQQRDIPLLLDFNYRGKLWQWQEATPPRQLAIESLRQLLPAVGLLVAGQDEICELAGLATPPATTSATATELFAEAAQQLHRQYPNIRRMASTYRFATTASQQQLGGMLWSPAKIHWAPGKGASGEASAAAGGQVTYRLEHVVDRIGTGDAFTAALLYALTTAELADPQQAIEFATAAFCLSHSIEGDFNFSRRGEIEALVGGGQAGRVQR